MITIKSERLTNTVGTVIGLSINGTWRELLLEPRGSLLDALRNHLDPTGAKREEELFGVISSFIERHH